MLRGSVLLLLACALLGGCSESDTLIGRADSPEFARVAGDGPRTLAYQHFVTFDVPESAVEARHAAVLAACEAVPEDGCVVLDARLNLGRSPNASVHMRVVPDAVEGVVEGAGSREERLSQHTRVEDLADTIVDVEGRLELLRTTRQKLLEIEADAADDVASLVAVTTELQRVQHDLERLTAQRAALALRVEREELTITFRVERSGGAMAPVGEALEDFGTTFGEGVAGAIDAFALLLPSLPLIVLLLFVVRWVWRRGRS